MLTSVIARWSGVASFSSTIADEFALRVANDAAQPGRVGLRRRCPAGRPARGVANSASTARSDDTCTIGESPAKNQHRALVPGQSLAAHHHRMAGAELFGLHGKLDARLAGQFRANQIAPIADDDDDPFATPAARTASIT